MPWSEILSYVYYSTYIYNACLIMSVIDVVVCDRSSYRLVLTC